MMNSFYAPKVSVIDPELKIQCELSEEWRFGAWLKMHPFDKT